MESKSRALITDSAFYAFKAGASDANIANALASGKITRNDAAL